MKRSTLLSKCLLTVPVLLSLTGCLNEAKQAKAKKKGFQINESKALKLMSSEHKTQASSLTVFWIPNSGIDPKNEDQDISTLSKSQLHDKRAIVRTIVNNSAALETKGPEAQKAYAYINSPKTQCMSLFGLQKCDAGKEELGKMITTLALKQDEISSNQTTIDNKVDTTYEKIDESNAQIKILNESIQDFMTESSESTDLEVKDLRKEKSKHVLAIRTFYKVIDEKYKPILEKLNQKQAILNAKQVVINGKVSQCNYLAGQIENLQPFLKNGPSCKNNLAKVYQAKALKDGMVAAVGANNWLDTTDKNATNNSVQFKEDKIEIQLVFGLPNIKQEIDENKNLKDFKQAYSTDDRTIYDVHYEEKTRSLKFKIEEKDQKGNFTGAILEISLEKTATSLFHKYSGCIKRYINGIMRAEGKMVIDFRKD